MERDAHPYRILIVEDNPGDYVLIEEYLLEHLLNPEISLAKCFISASEFLKKSAEYDAIFLDLSLPDLNGRELIESMLALTGDAPLIVLTGYPDFAFSVESMELGVSDYLLKDELNAFSLYKSLLYNIERRRNLHALRESEKQYSNLFHLSPQPMWVYSVDDYKFIDVNEAAVSHYGYTKKEFKSMTIFEILPSEDIVEAQAMVSMARAVEKLSHQGQYRHKKKNGDVFYVEVRSTLINLAGKKAEIVLAIDINERYEYIEHIEQQNEKLREIAWIQSHVVRAPLSRIMGIVELLRGKNLEEKDFGQLMDFLDISATELDGVIKQITDKTSKVNLGNFVKKE